MTDVVMVEPDQVLRRQVSELTQLAVRLDNNLGVVGNQVAAVDNAQRLTRSELGELRAAFDEYVGKAERRANVQLAQTRVGVLEARLENEFGRYDTVRRVAAGLLWAFDRGLVKQETVESVTEQLMIENPRYWLAPVVVGLGAWSGNDQKLCEDAIAVAYQLAPARTALMFALIVRRQHRQPSSVRWLGHYLDNLDPMALSREFAVVLESIAQGAFGTGGRQLIRETVDRWLSILADDEDAQTAQVRRWRFEIDQYGPAGAAPDFALLAKHSPQWPDLERSLRGAETHQPFLDHYRALVAAEYTPTERIEDSIDDILDILVAEYDEEELPLRRELEEENAVLKYEGDKVTARAAADANAAALGETLDYLTVQSSAALDPAAIGVSPATQQVALATCVPWIERAHGTFCMDYRRALPGNVEVHFNETHPFGKEVFTLPPWSGSLTATPMPELEGSLTAHWDAAAAPLLARLQFDFGRQMLVPSIVSALILLVGLAINPVAGIVVGAAVFGLWYLAVNKRRNTAEAYRRTVAEALEQQKQAALGELRGTGAEHTDYRSRYRAADEKAPQVAALVGSFADLGNDKTPYDRRVVRSEGIDA
ncbi:MAG TPA: hypothetical protein VGX23_23390 [Actinocrinis sp.]|nr:hypothetical protein [Actinocrinis sp.]